MKLMITRSKAKGTCNVVDELESCSSGRGPELNTVLFISEALAEIVSGLEILKDDN